MCMELWVETPHKESGIRKEPLEDGERIVFLMPKYLKDFKTWPMGQNPGK